MQESSTSPSHEGDSDEELTPPLAADDEQPVAPAAAGSGFGEANGAPVDESAIEPDQEFAGVAESDFAEFPVAPEWNAPRGVPFTAGRHALALNTPWTFRQTLMGAGLTLIPWLVFALGSQLLSRGTPAPIHPHRLAPSADLAQAVVLFVVSAALEAVFLIAPLYYATHTLLQGTSGREKWGAALRALGLRLPDPRLALSATVLAILVILGASVAYSDIVNTLRLPLKTNVDTLLAQAHYEPYTVIGTLLVAVVVAPFCEETFFRGYLFPGLTRGMQLWLAVLLSAALFGLAHADLGSFAVLFVIGIVLAVVRARTDSLWPGIAVHTLNNTIAFISILVLLRH